MKYAAIILNLVLVSVGIFLLAKHGAPDSDEAFIVFMIFAAPIASLLALQTQSPRGVQEDRTP